MSTATIEIESPLSRSPEQIDQPGEESRRDPRPHRADLGDATAATSRA